MLLKSLLLLPLLAVAAAVAAAPQALAPPPPPPPKAAAAAVAADGPIVLPDQSGVAEPIFESCPQGPDWVRHGDYCYLLERQLEYWEPAERRCNGLGGHLVSVRHRLEDSFVAKLTYCRNTWLGLYAVNAFLLDKPENYRWTDGTNRQYANHANITPPLHFPLKSTVNLTWVNNVYHAKQPYVCKVHNPERNNTCNCPPGWREVNGQCFLMPSFEATYIEADFYCRGRDAYVASVLNQRELRAMSLLDVDTFGCPFDTWIGLLKLNPCRADFATGAQICYRWSDRSGDYKSFPTWKANHPIQDRETNCVLLENEQIKTVPCHTRARFVCKKAVRAMEAGRPCVK